MTEEEKYQNVFIIIVVIFLLGALFVGMTNQRSGSISPEERTQRYVEQNDQLDFQTGSSDVPGLYH